MQTHPVIDSDGHVMEPGGMWAEYMPSVLRDRAPRMPDDSELFLVIDGVNVPPRHLFPSNPEVVKDTIYKASRFQDAVKEQFSARSHIDGLDVEGIDTSILFPTRGLMVMGVDGVDPTITTAAAHAYNTWLAEYVSESHNRLLGVAMIDPRDVNGAVAEAQLAVGELGFVAAFLRPNPVGGLPWHDPVYEPLWSALEELDVPVCFHEGAAVLLPQVGVDRFSKHSFWHCVTHPFENQMAMMSIVLGGVAERHPGLRFGFMECGAGWLPYWMWRLDEHVENEPHDFPYLSLEPSEYVERQCFVSIDSDEVPGIATLDVLQHPHVVWGSDYPHSDSKFPNAFKTLSSLPGMTEDRLHAVVYDGPLELFGKRLAAKLEGPKATPSGQRPMAT